jgi:hypothetical protein
MKKIVLVLLFLSLAAGFVFSGDLMKYPPPLEGGDILIDLGLGWAFSAADTGISIKIPPIVLNAEYCLPFIPISVGALAGFYQLGWTGGYSYWNETWTYATFGGRANWHWNFDVSWLDFYTGVFFGYTHFSFTSNYISGPERAYGGIEYGGQVGVHFYFTKNIGAVAELGYPFVAKAGVAFKF